MSLYIDKKYINLISSSLEKFKWKGDGLANCRCKLCGDSERNKNKARGYFFHNNDTYFYKCHNCGASLNLYSFLQSISPALAHEYNFERFKDIKEAEEILEIKIAPKICEDIKVQSIESLPSTHKARVYVESRNIPRKFWSSLGYTDDFNSTAIQFDESYKDRFDAEERLIIKIRDKDGICGMQGRSLDKNSKVKYITLKKKDNMCYFNLNKVDLTKQFFVTEGPFDSMFLTNAFATLGLSKMKNISKEIDDTNAVYILDNEPRNSDVVSMMDYLISQNKKICIFPKTVRKKDINDMILANLDIYGIIMNNIYDGLRAKLVFNKWRKI